MGADSQRHAVDSNRVGRSELRFLHIVARGEDNGLSLPRKRESRYGGKHWIPVSA